jgi:hypothetical protein
MQAGLPRDYEGHATVEEADRDGAHALESVMAEADAIIAASDKRLLQFFRQPLANIFRSNTVERER